LGGGGVKGRSWDPKNDKSDLGVEYKHSFRREHYSYRTHIFSPAPLTPLLFDSLYRQVAVLYLINDITSNGIMLIHTNFHENQSTGLQVKMTCTHDNMVISYESTFFSFSQKERGLMTKDW